MAHITHDMFPPLMCCTAKTGPTPRRHHFSLVEPIGQCDRATVFWTDSRRPAGGAGERPWPSENAIVLTRRAVHGCDKLVHICSR